MNGLNICSNCQFNKDGELSEFELRETNATILRKIKNTLRKDGYWYGDFAQWNDIVAVCNLETLLNFGVNLDERWSIVDDNGISQNVGIKEVISYLDSRIHVNSKTKTVSFGEDIWDLFRLATVIAKFKLDKYFKNYKSIKTYCQTIADKPFETYESNWSGPAVIAVAIDFFKTLDDTKNVSKLKARLLDLQNKDDSWGPIEKRDIHMNVWHTAQVLSIINFPNKDRSVERLLFNVNTKEFNNQPILTGYYTAHTLLALFNCGYISNEYFTSKMLDIKNKLDNDLIFDRGSLSMIGTVLSRIFSSEGKIINQIVHLDDNAQVHTENIELKKENEKLKKKYSKYLDGGLFIPKRILTFLCWGLGVVISAVVTTLITLFITKYWQ